MAANVTSQTDTEVMTEPECQDMYVSGSSSPGLGSTSPNTSAMQVPTYVVTEVSDTGDIQVQTTQSSIEVDATTDGPFCLVCNDKGSGYHYSVYSCEGCKGFFKRSVQKCLAYSCKEISDCVINKYTRNSCQHCRFKKCVEVGMRRDAVREDRTPGGKHRHKRPRIEEYGTKPSTMSEIMSSVAPQPLTAKSTATTTLILPQEPYDDALIQRLIDASPDLYPSNEVVPPEGMAQMDINDLMQYGYIELRYIIDWARKVPGFSDLLIEDQMALLKASFMELNVLRLSFRSLDCDGRVKFAKGVVMAPSESTHIGWGSDLINCTLEFISRLKDAQFDKTEFCILNAIILTYPDAAGVQDKDAVTLLQCQILDSLRKYVIRTYPSEPRRYGKILLRLPALRCISAKAAERFLSMSLDGSVKMNALVLEIMS